MSLLIVDPDADSVQYYCSISFTPQEGDVQLSHRSALSCVCILTLYGRLELDQTIRSAQVVMTRRGFESLSSEGLDLHDHTQARLYVTSPQTREDKAESAEGLDLIRHTEPESNDSSEQSSFS